MGYGNALEAMKRHRAMDTVEMEKEHRLDEPEKRYIREERSVPQATCSAALLTRSALSSASQLCSYLSR